MLGNTLQANGLIPPPVSAVSPLSVRSAPVCRNTSVRFSPKVDLLYCVKCYQSGGTNARQAKIWDLASKTLAMLRVI